MILSHEQLEELEIEIRQSIADGEPAEIQENGFGYPELTNKAIDIIASTATASVAAYLEKLAK